MIEKKTSIKLNNQLRIISVLQNKGPLSRKVIAEKLNLTRASITQLSNEMIALGIIEEIGEAQEVQSRAGRKEILVDIKEDYWYLLGIHIEIDSVSLGLVTIKGKTIEKEYFYFNILSRTENILNTFIDKLALNIDNLIKRAEISLEKIFYCGIGMVGRENYYQFNNLTMPPILNNRKQLVVSLEQKFGFPVTLDNNVRALAVAESQFFPEVNHSYLYIKFGPGLGSAIVFNHELYIGVNNQAGEIGSLLVSEFYPEYAKDKTITLEEIISLQFIQKELTNYWNSDDLPYLYNSVEGNLEKLTIQEIYQALELEELIIVKLYKKKMKILAQKIFDSKNMLDLNMIYLFFSTRGTKMQVLYDYLIKELNLLSRDLAAQIQLSQISICQSYLGGAGIAYVEGLAKLEDL